MLALLLVALKVLTNDFHMYYSVGQFLVNFVNTYHKFSDIQKTQLSKVKFCKFSVEFATLS